MKPFNSTKAAPWILAVCLLGWVAWLRAPSLHFPVWNVDETIHATVADVLLDGGVLYRDAIDQRSPLSYYTTAAVFAITGPSLVVLRYLVLGMIVAAAWFLGRTVWRTGNAFSGCAAAFVFAGFTSFLLFPGDTFAYHTEWFVVLFSSAAAWVFFGGKEPVPSPRRCGAVGFLLGLAVMSKQSALLDLAPPLLALMALGLDRDRTWSETLQSTAAVMLGVLGSVTLLIAPSIIAGAGRDLLYYTWTYNVEIYGAEFGFGEKLASGLGLVESLRDLYPGMLLLATVGLLVMAVRVVQFQPGTEAKKSRHAEVYAVAWTITSFGGAMAGGRGFEHYFFPVLAPLAWICVWPMGALVGQATGLSTLPLIRRITAGLVGLVIVASALWIPQASRDTAAPPTDPAEPAAAWIKEQSTRDDRVFVWGFNPDIYHYTNRLPASRFLYCTFQTGLIPWTNIDPLVDTSYAVVPGTMDTLLEDLHNNVPRFVVDSSAGEHRFFGKYPIREFPIFDLLTENYAEVHPARFGGTGFRIYLRTDEAIDEARRKLSADEPGPVGMDGHDRLAAGLSYVNVAYDGSSAGEVTGLGLIRDGEILAAARYLPTDSAILRFPVRIDEGVETVALQPIIKIDDGPWLAGVTQEAQVAASSITADQRVDFSIPLLGTRVEADGLRALFGARSDVGQGLREFAMHAPALLTYELPEPVDAISGRFGLPAAAYSEDNPTPSDGAEFIIRFLPQNAPSREVFRRAINPHIEPSDRGEHGFRVVLPDAQAGDRIELEITPGPSGVASSDWTYWSNLLLETSL